MDPNESSASPKCDFPKCNHKDNMAIPRGPKDGKAILKNAHRVSIMETTLQTLA